MVSQSPVGVESFLLQYLCIATDHVSGKVLNIVAFLRYFQEKVKATIIKAIKLYIYGKRQTSDSR